MSSKGSVAANSHNKRLLSVMNLHEAEIEKLKPRGPQEQFGAKSCKEILYFCEEVRGG